MACQPAITLHVGCHVFVHVEHKWEVCCNKPGGFKFTLAATAQNFLMKILHFVQVFVSGLITLLFKGFIKPFNTEISRITNILN
jgi:hypothetical protein